MSVWFRIRNTVVNGVDLNTVVHIARDHDIRPDDFDVLNGLKQINDLDGKSFFLLDTGHPALIAVVITLGFVFAAEGSVSAQAAYLPEIFGSRYRYAGVTLGREMASMLGGTGPLVCSALVGWAAGSWVPVAVLMMVVTLVSLVATLRGPETRDRDLYTEADAA